MQGLEESKEIHYILELLDFETKNQLKTFIIQTLSATSSFIHRLITDIYAQNTPSFQQKLLAKLENFPGTLRHMYSTFEQEFKN